MLRLGARKRQGGLWVKEVGYFPTSSFACSHVFTLLVSSLFHGNSAPFFAAPISPRPPTVRSDSPKTSRAWDHQRREAKMEGAIMRSHRRK
ncbi:hypothetical protein K1719_028738 [Acacia pycnantha]|nr:hypothetical protein K1719_028738 [Acacia pycnantha]